MATDVVLKILTLGETSVGKTSIIMRYTEDKFSQQFLSTVGIDFKSKIIEHKGKKIKVLLVDTSGQVRFRNIAANYYKSADGILFVYDVTQKDTLSKFEFWLGQIKEEAKIGNECILLFGNKNDNEEKRQITLEEAKTVADKYQLPFMEGSAQTGTGVVEAIGKIIDNILMTKSYLEEESIDTTMKLQAGKGVGKYAQKIKEQEYKERAGCC